MKKVFIGLVPFLALFLCIFAFAEDAEIKKNSVVSNLGLYGGQAEDIALDYGTDNVYVSNFAPNGLYHSNDGGTTWEGLPSDVNIGVGKAVEVDQDTGYVYALIGDALLKSTDLGKTFIDITADTGVHDFYNGLVIGHNRLVIARNHGSVLIGEGKGASYSSVVIENESDILALAVSPATDTYYAVAEDASDNDTLYQSTDGGATWTDMDVHSKGVAVGGRFYRVEVDPQDANHIVLTSIISGNPNYQTLDGGAAWTALSAEGQNISGGYAAFDGSGTLFTSAYYTDDAYASPIVFTRMANTTPLSFSGFNFLVVDRENPNTLYVDTGLGVAKSTDKGASWTDIVNGITAVKTYAVSQATDKDIVWVGANGGLARTNNFTDSDPAWTYPILPDQSISYWMGLWVKPDDPDMVVAAGSTSIFKSENCNDAVPTWTEVPLPSISAGQFKKIIADPNDDNTLYTVMMNDNLGGADDGAVLKSEDLGSTWTDLEITNDKPATCITMSKDGVLFAGIGGDAEEKGVYKMNAAGEWSKPSTDMDDYTITAILADPADENVIYATIESNEAGGFYKSEDKGENWENISTGLTDIMNLSTLALQTSTDPDTLYVAGQGTDLNGAIYKSSDAGESWDLLYTGLKQESFYTLLYDGLMAGNDRGLYEIKSRAVVKIKSDRSRVAKGGSVNLTITAKDKVTEKKLKNKTIKIYRKTTGSYKLWKRIKTSNKGVIKLAATIGKQTRFKAKWKPTGKSAEEYANETSNILRVRLK